MSDRIDVLRSTRLLDSPTEGAFDRLTRLAGGLLGARIALISLVDDARQFFKSAWGLHEPWASRRETPLSHSFCQYVARDRMPLVVTDAREDARVRDNLAIADLGVIAYAGMPLIVAGQAIGALCVIDDKPRAWSDGDLGVLRDLADSVVSEVELRMTLRAANAQRALTAALVDSMGDAVLAIDPDRKVILANQAARRMFATRIDVGDPLPADGTALPRATRPDGTVLAAEDAALARGLRGAITDGVTFTLEPHGREPLWLEATGRPIVDPDGHVVAAVAIYRDVTERTGQADRYRALVGNIPRGVVAVFDRELRCLAIDGVLIRANGGEPRQLIGEPMRAAWAAAVGAVAFDAVEDIFRRTLAGELVTHDLVIGDQTLVLHTAPIRDERGRITAGLVLGVDCTAERQVEATLRRSEQIYRAIVKHLPNGAVLLLDRDLRYLAADGPIMEDLLRAANLTELVGLTVSEASPDDTREALLALYRGTLQGERRHREVTRGGRFYDLHTIPLFEAEDVSHALVFLYDVTERRLEAEELRWTRDQLAGERSLFEVTLAHIDDGVVLLDANLNILLANTAYAVMFGLDPAAIHGMTRAQFAAHVGAQLEDPEASLERLAAQKLGSSEEFVFIKPRRCVLRRTRVQVRLPTQHGVLVTWHDITSEKALLADREHQLLVDALTGIPNRRAALAALKVEHSRMRRAHSPLSIALFDIDHFKRINDDHGHASGDRVLCQVALVLAAQARNTDTVARWGGEEFLALLPGSLAGARVFCERTRVAIQNLVCPGIQRITASAGVAEVRPGEDPADAIARADHLLYQAKRAGRNRVAS